MTEFWKSNKRFYCEECNVWLTDVRHHENGNRHKANVDRKLKIARKNRIMANKESNKYASEIAAIERAAKRAFVKDCAKGLATNDTFYKNMGSRKQKRNSATLDRPDANSYYYKDRQGNTYGPFAEERMALWNYLQFFPPGLRIRRAVDIEFIHLRDITNAFNMSAFLHKLSTIPAVAGTALLESVNVMDPSTLPPALHIPKALMNAAQRSQSSDVPQNAAAPMPTSTATTTTTTTATDKDKDVIAAAVQRAKAKAKAEKDKKADNTDDFGFGGWETVTDQNEIDATIGTNDEKKIAAALQPKSSRVSGQKRWWRDVINANLPLTKKRADLGLNALDKEDIAEDDMDRAYGMTAEPQLPPQKRRKLLTEELSTELSTETSTETKSTKNVIDIKLIPAQKDDKSTVLIERNSGDTSAVGTDKHFHEMMRPIKEECNQPITAKFKKKRKKKKGIMLIPQPSAK